MLDITDFAALVPGRWYEIRHRARSKLVTHTACYVGEAFFETAITRTTSWGARVPRVRTLFVYPEEFIAARELSGPPEATRS